MVFGIFTKELRELIGKRFEKPTQVQFEGIPPIHAGEDTLVLASTGTGKTETVLLPVFDRWLRDRPRPISILYITPLRSLNRDLGKRISWWSEHMGMDCSVRHGDTTQYERGMQAANPPDMLISTPETLQAMLTGKIMRTHLSNVRFVVVDEIHELVDSKRGAQLSVGLERLKELIKSSGNPRPQFIGLSATVGTPEKVAGFLTSGKCRIIDTTELKNLDLKVESPEPGGKDYGLSGEMFVTPEIMARLNRIVEEVRRTRATLIFTNTREFAEILSSRLKAIAPDLPLDTHHSSLSKEVRVDAEGRLKEGKLRALVCTSSLELGIDIGDIDLTLQYMSPRQVAKLLQRTGRSGHSVGATSRGLIMASDADDCFESAVIAGLAMERRIESSDVYSMALDVLAHQIVGLSLEEYKIPLEKAFNIIKGAMPYRELTMEKFTEVCKFLERLRLVWLDDRFDEKPVIKRRKSAFEYYYMNLSTIPDVRNYRIIDIVSNSPVGSLDAEFLALHGSPGTSFICKGQAWRILEVKKSSVMVEPQRGIEAAIPAWEGELIPVPYDIAQGVGRMRGEIADKLKREGAEGAEKYLISRYPVTADVAKKMIGIIGKQMKSGHVPTEKEVLIEYSKGEDGYWVVMHTCFGSKVNETIGRCLTILLSSRLGSIGLQTDPYRIMLKLQVPRWNDVTDTFRYMEAGSIEGLLDIALPRTELFAWRFIQVAKRMGIIEKDADFGKGYLNKVVDAYLGTPACTEAMHEIKKEKLDVEKAKILLEDLQKGGIKLVMEEGLSPIGEMGLARKYEIVAPEKPENEILDAFGKRLLETKLRLLCANCGDWALTAKVKENPPLQCPRCGARLIGVAPGWDMERQKTLKKHLGGRELTDAEKEDMDYLLNTATMVMNYGHPALKVLAGRGVGWTTAKRILAKARDEEELLKLTLEAERNYAKNKRFWKE